MKRGEKGETKDEEVVSAGLLGGVSAIHLRMLMDNPWEGGGGFTPEQVGRFTIDQVWCRLCERDILKKDVGRRVQKMAGLNAASQISDEDGNLRARSAQGDEIKLKASGKSKAQMLREGIYEGWVINADTGEREWKAPQGKKSKRRLRSK